MPHQADSKTVEFSPKPIKTPSLARELVSPLGAITLGAFVGEAVFAFTGTIAQFTLGSAFASRFLASWSAFFAVSYESQIYLDNGRRASALCKAYSHGGCIEQERLRLWIKRQHDALVEEFYQAGSCSLDRRSYEAKAPPWLRAYAKTHQKLTQLSEQIDHADEHEHEHEHEHGHGHNDEDKKTAWLLNARRLRYRLYLMEQVLLNKIHTQADAFLNDSIGMSVSERAAFNAQTRTSTRRMRFLTLLNLLSLPANVLATMGALHMALCVLGVSAAGVAVLAWPLIAPLAVLYALSWCGNFLSATHAVGVGGVLSLYFSRIKAFFSDKAVSRLRKAAITLIFLILLTTLVVVTFGQWFTWQTSALDGLQFVFHASVKVTNAVFIVSLIPFNALMLLFSIKNLAECVAMFTKMKTPQVSQRVRSVLQYIFVDSAEGLFWDWQCCPGLLLLPFQIVVYALQMVFRSLLVVFDLLALELHCAAEGATTDRGQVFSKTNLILSGYAQERGNDLPYVHGEQEIDPKEALKINLQTDEHQHLNVPNRFFIVLLTPALMVTAFLHTLLTPEKAPFFRRCWKQFLQIIDPFWSVSHGHSSNKVPEEEDEENDDAFDRALGQQYCQLMAGRLSTKTQVCQQKSEVFSGIAKQLSCDKDTRDGDQKKLSALSADVTILKQHRHWISRLRSTKPTRSSTDVEIVSELVRVPLVAPPAA
jgi:hypothetical protein